MSQLLNETFQRHLKKLHKDLLIEIEDPNVNKNVDVSTDVLSPWGVSISQSPNHLLP